MKRSLVVMMVLLLVVLAVPCVEAQSGTFNSPLPTPTADPGAEPVPWADGDVPTLKAAAREAWRLYAAWPGGTLKVSGMGMPVWLGDLHGAAFNSVALTLTARGRVFRLDATELWRVYADADYAAWEPDDSDAFDRDNNNRVYIATRKGVVYEAGESARVQYPQAGIILGEPIVRVTAQAYIQIGNGLWVAELRKADETLLWTSGEIAGPQAEQTWAIDVGTDAEGLAFVLRCAATTEVAEMVDVALAGTGAGALSNGVYRYGVALVQGTVEMPMGLTGQVTVVDAGADGQVMVTLPTGGEAVTGRRIYRTAADGEEFFLLAEVADNVTAQYLDNTIDGDLGTALLSDVWAKLLSVIVRTMDPTEADAIIEEVLDGSRIAVREIGAPGLEIDRLRSQGGRGIELIEQLAELGDGSQPWIFAVYEYGAEFREWYYAETDATAGWLLLAQDVAEWDLGSDLLDTFNAVRAHMPDGTFTTWQEDAESIERYGRREKTLEIPQTSQAEATRWAQIYLYESAHPLAEVRTSVGALVQRRDGTTWPAYMVRAGDLVVVRDLIPGQDIGVQVREAEYVRGKLRITPVGAANTLERLLAARELRAVQQVVSGGTGGEALTWAVVSDTEPESTFTGQTWVDTSV